MFVVLLNPYSQWLERHVCWLNPLRKTSEGLQRRSGLSETRVPLNLIVHQTHNFSSPNCHQHQYIHFQTDPVPRVAALPFSKSLGQGPRDPCTRDP